MDSEDDYRFNEDQKEHKEDSEDDSGEIQQKSHSSEHSESSQNQSERNSELNEKQRLEFDILQSAIKYEKSTSYQDEITRELIQKLNDLNVASRLKIEEKNVEELINIRIQQLAYSKLLVLNYGKSEFRLVMAHYHLGEAYISYGCLEQAIEHISIALHKNEKLAEEIPKTKQLQIAMYITLAEAYMGQNNYDDAIDTLKKVELMQHRLSENFEEEGQPERNIQAQVLLSQCLCKQKKFVESLSVIDEVINQTKNKQNGKVEYAFALIDKASIFAEMQSKQKLQRAIQCQEEGINWLVKESYAKPEEVAELYATLSIYYEKINNSQNSLACIQKVKTLYEQLYSPEDKRVIKARRKIATALLKIQRFQEAIGELLEIQKLEEKVFGDSSIQLARTLKLLGTVYSSKGSGDAKVYLRKAMTIFQSLGFKSQADEIKEKMRHLMFERPSGDNNSAIISQQQI